MDTIAGEANSFSLVQALATGFIITEGLGFSYGDTRTEGNDAHTI